jgi:hypothetical protein
MMIAAPAVERWQRDYYRPFDLPAPYYSMSALRLEFSSSADSHNFTAVWTRGDSNERPSDDDRSAILADQLSGLTLGGDQALLQPALAKVAVMFERQWVSRPMPPMVMEFVNRYAPSRRP